MPLHLLGKKSWNVYNADNVARVKRDEAIAAAHEEEVERRMQEHDAACRAAILRGLPPPPTPSPPPAPSFKTSREDKAIEAIGGDRDRKRKRLRGEDDTDRDIRLARLQNEALDAARDNVSEDLVKKRKKQTSDAPLFDRQGHLDLFPIDQKAMRRAEKAAEAEAEAKKKKQEQEELCTMRFADAAGKNSLDKRPWYASGSNGAPQNDVALQISDDAAPSKDAWGRPDPGRKDRDARRLNTADPLSFMQKAQVQLKQAERDRKAWVEQRSREDQELKEMAERERRGRKRDELLVDNGLESFSLDATINDRGKEERYRSSRHHERHRHHSRTRSKDRERDRHRHYERSQHKSHRRDRSSSRHRQRERHRERPGSSRDKKGSLRDERR